MCATNLGCTPYDTVSIGQIERNVADTAHRYIRARRLIQFQIGGPDVSERFPAAQEIAASEQLVCKAESENNQ